MKKEKALGSWRGCPRLSHMALAGVFAAALAGCGGGSSGGGDTGGSAPPETSASRSEAARFLTQATFGPTDADIDRVMAIGYAAWIDEQFAKPQAAQSQRANWEAADAAVKLSNATGTIGQEGTINAFWKAAITGDDALRQRVVFALSEIFVISMQDGTVGDNPRAVSAYVDMLNAMGFGNYRDLLQSVALHPMMGAYLTSIKNQKADPRTGRVPDENFGREVMQLMSIGLHQLNADGSKQLSGGQPVETYTQADITGMSRVFTGWSWNCPDWPDNGCFFNGLLSGQSNPDRIINTMLGYPQFHSTEAKSFLGVTVAAQSKGDPDASLKTALDTLHAHPNVGPFIGRQLIQRLVTSNPSPQYVAAVTAAFNDNGSGVRGDLKAVVKAVLMNAEARTVTSTSGKLREPVLRLSAFLRAFGFKSDTGAYKVGNTDNPGTQLGQTPMRSPSVFNFFRPGYVPPGTEAAKANLEVPEMQLAQETTTAGYVNFMRDNVSWGVGSFNGTVGTSVFNRRDLQPDF
ncbi:MAG: DUF1800 domain-containing protein, partial [Burkholderiaceae bacterium]